MIEHSVLFLICAVVKGVLETRWHISESLQVRGSRVGYVLRQSNSQVRVQGFRE